MTVLVTLRPGLSLEALAAESWARMEAARGRPLDVNRSTVSRASQFTYYYAYQRYLNGGPWAPLALHPDNSWHCEPRARAVDTDDDAWIRGRPEYGWRFVVKSEKWHAQYYPEHDKFKGQPAGGGAKPLPTPQPSRKESDMLIFQVTKTWDGGGIQGQVYALAPGSLYVARNQTEANQLAKHNNPDGKLIAINDEQLLIEFDARGIPRELATSSGGVNWSWSKEAAT